MTEETRLETVVELRRLGNLSEEGKAMDAFNIDIVLAPSDSTLVTFAACAGWPIATVPLGRWEKNGQPYGFFAVAKNGREDLLFDFMVRFRSSFPPLAGPSCPFDEDIVGTTQR